MGGIPADTGGLQQGYRIRGGGGGDVVAENGVQEEAVCYIKTDPGGNKGSELETWQALRGRGRHGSSGVGV